jgi:hypothetical protein
MDQDSSRSREKNPELFPDRCGCKLPPEETLTVLLGELSRVRVLTRALQQMPVNNPPPASQESSEGRALTW